MKNAHYNSNFNSSDTKVYRVFNQTGKFLLLNNDDSYVLEKNSTNLTVLPEGLENNSYIFNNFQNGQNGIILPNEPIVIKDQLRLSNYSRNGTEEVFFKIVNLRNERVFTVWSSVDEAPNNCYDSGCTGDIFGQITNITENIGTYFRINNEPIMCIRLGRHISVSADLMTNGNIAVSWVKNSTSCSYYSGWGTSAGQIIDQSGKTVTNETTIGSNSYGTHPDNEVSLAALSGGGFAVAYSGAQDVDVKTYSANGAHLYNTERSYPPAGHFGDTSLVSLSNNRFVLGFDITLNWGTTDGISTTRAEIFNSSLPQIVVINDRSMCHKSASTSDGSKFVVTWVNATNYDFMAKTYSSNGSIIDSFKIGGRYHRDKCETYDIAYSVANKIFITYLKDTTPSLYGRILNENGQLLINEFIVTSSLSNLIHYPVVEFLDANRAIVSWVNQNGTSGSGSILGKTFNTNNLHIISPVDEECNIIGSALNDNLTNVAECRGNYILAGLSGDDIISSNYSNNTYIGGLGSDVFVINPNSNVTIIDFNLEDPDEIIDLSHFVNITPVVTQDGLDTLILLDDNSSVTINNIHPDNISIHVEQGEKNGDKEVLIIYSSLYTTTETSTGTTTPTTTATTSETSTGTTTPTTTATTSATSTGTTTPTTTATTSATSTGTTTPTTTATTSETSTGTTTPTTTTATTSETSTGTTTPTTTATTSATSTGTTTPTNTDTTSATSTGTTTPTNTDTTSATSTGTTTPTTTATTSATSTGTTTPTTTATTSATSTGTTTPTTTATTSETSTGTTTPTTTGTTSATSTDTTTGTTTGTTSATSTDTTTGTSSATRIFENEETGRDEKLSTGEIADISLGVGMVLVISVVVGAVCCMRSMREGEQVVPQPQITDTFNNPTYDPLNNGETYTAVGRDPSTLPGPRQSNTPQQHTTYIYHDPYSDPKL